MATKKTKTATLLIFAKSSWNDGYCYLGFDEASGRILRPVLSTAHKRPDDMELVPWSIDLEVGAYYTFKLPKFMNSVHDVNHSVSLPHRNDDLLVLGKDIFGPKSWVLPPPGQSLAAVTSPMMVSPMYKLLQPYSHDCIEDIFDLNFSQCERYIKTGMDCPSVGILRCWKSNLYLDVMEKPRITIYGDDDDEDRHLPFTVPDAAQYAQYINSGGPAESVLLIISLGRPFTANSKFTPPRCYLLVVGLVRKYIKATV